MWLFFFIHIRTGKCVTAVVCYNWCNYISTSFSIKLNFDYKTKALFPETITDYSENAIQVITWSGSFPVWGLPRSLQRILRVCADCTHVPSDCWDRKSLVTQVRGACLSRSSCPAGSTAPAFLAWFRWSHEFRYLILLESPFLRENDLSFSSSCENHGVGRWSVWKNQRDHKYVLWCYANYLVIRE